MPTVRVDPQLHAKLRALAASQRRSISHVIEEAVGDYEKAKFGRAMHEGYARLLADPAAWEDSQWEAALWDSVSGDGLEEEGPYYRE